MHSVRRAAFRAASSCSGLAMRQVNGGVSRTATRSAANAAAGFMPKVASPRVLSSCRLFSQTARQLEAEAQAEVEGEKAEETSIPTNQAEQPTSELAAEDAAPESNAGMATPPARSNQEDHSIFISNMTFDATDAHLNEAFSKYGEIQSVRVSRDGRGLSRGFGFIAFKTPDAAAAAVEATDKSFWHGRRINVEHRKAKDADQNVTNPNTASHNGEPSRHLFIGNIPYETSDADLNRLFGSLDGVIDVRVAVDRNTGWPRGFAHADFQDVSAATKALEKLQSVHIGGRILRADFTNSRISERRQRK